MNWDEMENVWTHTFGQLGVGSDAASGVLVTEALFNPPMMSKEQIVTRMFEKFNVQKLWVGTQPQMALCATGKTTGLIVEAGHGLTQTMPFYEGMPLNHGKDKNQMGGNTLNTFLAS